MRPSILFVTDLAYRAQGRHYGDEDVFLTSRLREEFDLALCHPRDAAALMDRFDAVVVVARDRLAEAVDGQSLIQPRVPFRYEVSFYFVDDAFQYALHAPDPRRRWALAPYAPTGADLAFARRFVRWNTLAHGVQRVDACRTVDGALLLVELEDLNPYLSLDLVAAEVREGFVAAMSTSLRRFLAAGQGL
ncbi:hypothetical protein V6U89_22880 [Micromonospora sp. CPCC 206171]|uniref:hypothetical protein n=1 Tax=Micromonospora sp. CPCC 206171 TaxID=3122405 RepID=UPI002FF31ACD